MLVLTIFHPTYSQFVFLEQLFQLLFLSSSISVIAWCKLGSNFFPLVSSFLILFFSNIEIKSFSTIEIFSKNLSKSLFDFKISSFLIAILALCKLSKIAKLSLAKLNDPNSKASFISFSNLLL